MEYFKSGLKSVLGTPNSQSQSSGAETIERLIDRLLSSTLLDDRRDACRALKALSRTYRIEVGAQGMDALKQILAADTTDCEIIGLALDTLCNVTSPESYDEEVDKYGQNQNIGEQFTEILIKNHHCVTQVLKFLEEFDFRVRRPALKLLTNLLSNKPKDTQEIILVSPMGISRLMDMLSDSREVIRNDGLLLLIQLTKGNSNIQKIVAFENAFDRIYDVISQEGGVEGGIVVEDCLLLMVNLLRGNYSNQNFFKEGSYIQRLTPMIQLSTNFHEDNSVFCWNPQKMSNVHCMIQVIRALVAPNGSIQFVTACQEIIKSCGLLQALCQILMISGVPADILTETICAVAEVIRGNKNNQEYLANVMAPSVPPRSAVVVLLMSMVNAKQPFNLRCAVLYSFQCFLFKNEIKQKQLVQTLLPQGSENSSLTTGQLLCGGLFSSDPLSNWFSAVALSHALIDGLSQKEQLLRVLLATNLGTPPVSLMHQCVILLQQSNEIQSKLGLLILLCRWTSYCTLAVKSFLRIEASVTYLFAILSSSENNEDSQEILLQSMCAFLIGILVHFNDDSVSSYTKIELCNLVENRIGFEKFQYTLGGIARHEFYSRTLKHPQSSAKKASEVLLDHEICRLLKNLEGTVLKSVLERNSSIHIKEETSILLPQESALISDYKTLISEQDAQIRKLDETIATLLKEKLELKNEVYQLNRKVDILTDQTKILRAAQSNYPENRLLSSASHARFDNQELNESNIDKREPQNNEVVMKLQRMLETKIKEVQNLKKDQEDLLELLTEQDKKLLKYKFKLAALNEKVDSDDSSGELGSDDNAALDC